MKQPRPGPLERIKDLCSEAVCTKCGMIGADVRPNWQPLQSHPLGHPERLLDSLPRLGVERRARTPTHRPRSILGSEAQLRKPRNAHPKAEPSTSIRAGGIRATLAACVIPSLRQ
jgi:hypothetical protein